MFYAYELLNLWELMETFNVGKLFISIVGLSNFLHDSTKGTSNVMLGIANTIPLENYQDMKATIDYICDELKRLDFVVSFSSAKELRNIILNEVEEKAGQPFPPGRWMVFSPLSSGRYQHYSNELVNRFKDEGSAKKVLILPSDREKFYDLKSPIWGNEVQDKFLDMIEDIVEANNCYALDRNTACVFHLMRVMEKAVQKLAIKLGITLTGEAWQGVINAIRGQLNVSYPSHSDPERIKYESILGHLETVKIAWRNPTMHPKTTYGEKEAKAILSAVEIFMEDLAKMF